jgi:DNA topoisomerase I
VADDHEVRRTVKPPTPFNTTALQAAAASEGLTPSRTMRIAESLYMSGLVSYPRVDNTVYPPSLDLRGILKTLDKVPATTSTSTGAPQAGFRSRPRAAQGDDRPPADPPHRRGGPREAQARGVQALQPRLEALHGHALRGGGLESTKVEHRCRRRAVRGPRRCRDQGRGSAVYPYGLKKEEHLPALAEGDTPVEFLGAQMEAKQTQPPARYSQGKMIQEMEKLGLGTKATRHDIIQTLYDRKYVTGDPIAPTCKGITVVNALVAHAERITTPEMTAELDAEMDEIARASASRDRGRQHSRDLLAEVMEALLEPGARGGREAQGRR